MTGVPFQIHRLGDVRQHVGLTGNPVMPVSTVQSHSALAFAWSLDEGVAQRLVAARDQGRVDASLGQPLLALFAGTRPPRENSRAGRSRLLAQLRQPAFHALAYCSPPVDGPGSMAAACPAFLWLVPTRARSSSVIQRQIGRWERPSSELDGGAQINQQNLAKNLGVIRGRWRIHSLDNLDKLVALRAWSAADGRGF